jgi:hypothetical protein
MENQYTNYTRFENICNGISVASALAFTADLAIVTPIQGYLDYKALGITFGAAVLTAATAGIKKGIRNVRLQNHLDNKVN